MGSNRFFDVAFGFGLECRVPSGSGDDLDRPAAKLGDRVTELVAVAAKMSYSQGRFGLADSDSATVFIPCDIGGKTGRARPFQ